MEDAATQDCDLRFFILGEDHLKLLAAWPYVPVRAAAADEFEGKVPDLYRWAQLADVAVERVRALWPALRDLGCVRPDRTVPAAVRQVMIQRMLAMTTERK